MANKKNVKNKSRKNAGYTQVEKAAYLMGMVSRGLENPDSRISDSYNRGASKPQPRQKKTLF